MPNVFEEYLKEHGDELLAPLKQVVNRATTHRYVAAAWDALDMQSEPPQDLLQQIQQQIAACTAFRLVMQLLFEMGGNEPVFMGFVDDNTGRLMLTCSRDDLVAAVTFAINTAFLAETLAEEGFGLQKGLTGYRRAFMDLGKAAAELISAGDDAAKSQAMARLSETVRAYLPLFTATIQEEADRQAGDDETGESG